MATETAAPPTARPAPPRRLWQVPTFLVGAAVFAAAYKGVIPIGPADPDAGFKADLVALVTAIQQPGANGSDLKLALERLTKTAGTDAAHGAAAGYALGSGYARLAELTADPGDARGWWVLARQHFAAADEARVPESERPRFAFRRAKAQAADLPATATPAEIELVRTVLAVTPIGEDAGDAPRLAAELGLRVVPPDLRRAKDGFMAYLAATGSSAPAATVARVKLRLSEVHLALRELDAAKKWLSEIGTDAPADVLPAAKAQLARIRMGEQDWAGAARDWEAARAAHDFPPALRASAAFYLAECRLKLTPDDPAVARLLDEAAKGTGPEASAAAVRLAGVAVKNPDAARRKTAVGFLTAAVRGVRGPDDLAGGLVTPVEYQAAFEQTVAVLTADGAFPEAVAAAEAYRPIADGKDRELKADAYAAWGAALEKAGADGKARYAAAAAEYAALAAGRPDDGVKADRLRRAAGLLRKAGDTAAALAALEQAARVPALPDDVAGPVWAEYADVLLVSNQPAAAAAALNRAMATAGPSAVAARYTLARTLIGTRDPRKVPLGVELLGQIAGAERVAPAEQAVHQKALADLGDQYLQAKNFGEAEARLRVQLRLYPAGDEATKSRLLLGTVLLQKVPHRKGEEPPAEEKRVAEEALDHLRQVMTDVDTRKAAGRAQPADPWLRTQAGLRVLRALVLLNRPQDVAVVADLVRPATAGTVEELLVLSMKYHAAEAARNANEQNAVKAEIRRVFDQLKDRPGAFPAQAGEYSRGYWEDHWLN